MKYLPHLIFGVKIKLLIVVLLLIGSISTTVGKSNDSVALCKSFAITSVIDDGWYEARVMILDGLSGVYSTYTLKVYVQRDVVTIIDFGNGGSVHSGYNNSGYEYYGGELDFEKNAEGVIVAATALVVTSDLSRGPKTYTIRIGSS